MMQKWEVRTFNPREIAAIVAIATHTQQASVAMFMHITNINKGITHPPTQKLNSLAVVRWWKADRGLFIVSFIYPSIFNNLYTI